VGAVEQVFRPGDFFTGKQQFEIHLSLSILSVDANARGKNRYQNGFTPSARAAGASFVET
jgi:hypothetical protein